METEEIRTDTDNALAETGTGTAPAEDLRAMIETAMDAPAEGEAELSGAETEPAETVAPAPADDDAAIDDAQPEAGDDGEDAPDAPIEPPAHWSAADQTMFRGQSPDAQLWLLERHKSMEADYTRKTQEVAPLRDALAQWQPYLEQIGATPDKAFGFLVGAEYQLRTGTEAQKRAMLIQLAHDYGITLDTGADHATGAGMDEDDPFAADMRAIVAPIQQEVQQLRAGFETQASAAQQAQAASAVEQVRLFREEMTGAGTPAHPYFDEVQEAMTRLAQADRAAGQTPVLSDLYERAIWSVPEVRAKLLAAQQHAAAQEAERAKRERVAKAKTASGSITGGGSAPKEQPKSLREELETQFAQYQ